MGPRGKGVDPLGPFPLVEQDKQISLNFILAYIYYLPPIKCVFCVVCVKCRLVPGSNHVVVVIVGAIWIIFKKVR